MLQRTRQFSVVALFAVLQLVLQPLALSTMSSPSGPSEGECCCCEVVEVSACSLTEASCCGPDDSDPWRIHPGVDSVQAGSCDCLASPLPQPLDRPDNVTSNWAKPPTSALAFDWNPLLNAPECAQQVLVTPPAGIPRVGADLCLLHQVFRL